MATSARLCATVTSSDGRSRRQITIATKGTRGTNKKALPYEPFVPFCGKLFRKEAIMETDFKNITGMFKTNTDIVNKALEGVEPEHWFRKPGDDSNHLTWVLGHLIVHRAQTLKW